MEDHRSYWVNVYVNGVSSSFPCRTSADAAPYPKSRIAVVEFVIKGKTLEDVRYHPMSNPELNPGHRTIVVNDWERSREYLLQGRPIRTSRDYKAEGTRQMSNLEEDRQNWEDFISACEKDG